MSVNITVEFSGGLELLFDKVKKHQIKLGNDSTNVSSSSSSDSSVSASSSASSSSSSVSSSSSSSSSSSDSFTMQYLIKYIRDHVLKERPELFVQDDTVRPGILVLINDCDWELEDGLNYQLKDKDNIVFISTLHGG